MLRFSCPKCKTVNQQPDSSAGQVVACASCQQKMRVPAPRVAAPRKQPVEKLDVLEEVPDTEEEIEEVEPVEPRDEEDDRRGRKRGGSRDPDLGEKVKTHEAGSFQGVGGSVVC